MSKKIFLFLLAASVVFSFGRIALADSDNNKDQDQILPETDGTYDVPKHPKLKLRVIVHKAKSVPGGKPSGPTLVCSLPDKDSPAVPALIGWHLPAAWTYSLNVTSVPASVNSGNLATIAAMAFSRWTNATGNKVVITQAPNTTVAKAVFDGKNIIAWGNPSSGALAVTYTWYYPGDHTVAEVDTIINQKYSWAWSNPAVWGGRTPAGTTCAYSNVYDVQDILTHELGHWMGLSDEYDAGSFQNNTMYGYGSTAETQKDSLTTGDVSGLRAIYP